METYYIIILMLQDFRTAFLAVRETVQDVHRRSFTLSSPCGYVQTPLYSCKHSSDLTNHCGLAFGMWHTHCATVRSTTQQSAQLFCALGTEVVWGNHRSEQKTTENHFYILKLHGQSQVRFIWSPASWSRSQGENWFAILCGQGQ